MKWYDCFIINERPRYIKEMSVMVIGRGSKMSNVIEKDMMKMVI